MKNKKFDGILFANFITNIFYTMTYPFIYKVLFTNISEKIIAISTIVTCISVIFFCSIWNQKKIADYLYNIFPLFCIGEFICSILLTLYLFNTNSYSSYYLYETFSTALVTRNIFCGMTRLKAIRYNQYQREKFDNNNNAICSLGTIIGSSIALIINLDFHTMLWIATFGNAVDNLSYIIIFYKTKNTCEVIKNVNKNIK